MDILNHGALARHRGTKRMLPARGQDDSRFDSIILTQALNDQDQDAAILIDAVHRSLRVKRRDAALARIARTRSIN